MRAIFFRFLCHEANIGNASHGGGIESAVLLAEVDCRLIDPGVGTVRYNELGILLLAIRSPHLTGRSNRGRHRGVDNNVARHVKIGDPFVGVHHREVGTVLVDGLNVRFNFSPLGIRKR